MAFPKISLAEWSLHKSIESGRIKNIEFPAIARKEFGIDAVELVSVLMEGHDTNTLNDLRARADDEGVRILLIMCDDEGDLSHPDIRTREAAAKNHRKWIDAAAQLSCHGIRVNSGGGDFSLDLEAVKRCAESCNGLLEYAEQFEIQVLIENHGGISSQMDLLIALMHEVNHPLFGILPDFGNFSPGTDIYSAVEQMMPFATRAVSAKSYDFDDTTGEETTIDYSRMLEIVGRADYQGYLGIEYEGDRLEEFEGIRRTKLLLERLLEGKE